MQRPLPCRGAVSCFLDHRGGGSSSHITPALYALLLTLALTLSVAAKAQPNDDAARTAAALTSLTAEIAAIQALLEASEQERDSLQSALREIDTQIGESDLQLDLLTNEQAALQQQLDGLDAKSVGIRTAQKSEPR